MSLRPARRRATAVAVALALLPTPGCSWLFVHTPPQGPVQAAPPIECESKAIPIFDAGGAALLGLGGILVTAFGLSLDTAPCGGLDVLCASPQDRSIAIAVGVTMVGAATALAFSASHGFSATEECAGRQEVQLQLSCSSGVEEACRALQERKAK